MEIVVSLRGTVWGALALGIIVGLGLGFGAGVWSGVRAFGHLESAAPSRSPHPIDADGSASGASTSADSGERAAAGKPVGSDRSARRAFSRSRAAKADAKKAAAMSTKAQQPQPEATSTLTLRAHGASAGVGKIAADVFVDGRLVGRAPIEYLPVTPGEHRIRFDCIFEGKTYTGDETVLDVPAETDAVVDHKCDVLVFLGGPGLSDD